MKVPIQLLPTLPMQKMESTTIYHVDFVPQPPFQRPKNFKPEEKYLASGAKMMTVTSYSESFPQQPLTATYPATSLMETTLPNNPGRFDNLETSHQQLYKPWPGFHRPYGYCEPLQSPMFQGKFSGLTVTMQDYPQKPLCRPRTCYKREEEGILPNANKVLVTGKAFKLPEITDYPKLQNCSTKSTSLKACISSKENTYQHHLDKALSMTPHPRNGICHSLPCRNSEVCDTLNSKPVRKELNEQLDDATVSAVGGNNGPSAQTLDGKMSERAANRSEYFQFSTTTPHIRHGDKSEREFRPSEAKFVGVSENHSMFVSYTGKSTQLVKPPLGRQPNYQPANPTGEEPFTANTTYHHYFPIRSLPEHQICLAEQMLQA